MYLIAKFEKKVKDLSKVSVKIPESEKEISSLFEDDVLNFLSSHKEFMKRNVMKIPFQTVDMIGVEIYLI